MARRTQQEYENLIQKHMRTLQCTREEAIDVIRCDDEIDKGNKELFALSDEQKKLVRKITKADTDPNKKRTVKKERKIDDDKKILIEMIAKTFKDYENLSVKNETEVSFTYNENEYSIKLTKHRKNKK